MDGAGQVELQSLDTNVPNQCPLCKSEVREFFINFNEKLLMCENTDCEYPFGHEPLQFSKENNEIDSDDEVMSIGTGMLDTNGTLSVTGNSAACWAEVEKLNKADNSEEQNYLANKSSKILEEPNVPKKSTLMDEKIQDNIKAISKLTTELSDEKPVMIKNKQWIKNLQEMQSSTSKEMVKPMELLECDQESVTTKVSALKIDISSNANEMASITIEINKTE